MNWTVVGMAKGQGAEDRRIVRTRERYKAALERLVNGKPKHQSFKEALRDGSGYSINPTNVALEAGMSRDPLYSRHRDVLVSIHNAGQAAHRKPKRGSPERARDDSDRVDELRSEISTLKRDKAKLATENLGLLRRLSVATQLVERLGRDKARLTQRISSVAVLRAPDDSTS